MNRIYRSIWNDKTGTFVAASENAKSGGKKSSSGASAVARGARFAHEGILPWADATAPVLLLIHGLTCSSPRVVYL